MKATRVERDEVLEETVPFKLRPQRGSNPSRIVITPAKGGKPIWDYSKELVLPIALGHAWAARLANNEFCSTNALAADLGLDPSLVMRYMRLTRLAPDIIEAILCGQQPPALKQEDLFRHMPYAWVEQRKLLGFTAQRAAEVAQAALGAPPSPTSNGVQPAPAVPPTSTAPTVTRESAPPMAHATPPTARDFSPTAAQQPVVRKPASARPKHLKPAGAAPVVANETQTNTQPTAVKAGIPHQTSLFGPE